jgi:hypothetical protein
MLASFLLVHNVTKSNYNTSMTSAVETSARTDRRSWRFKVFWPWCRKVWLWRKFCSDKTNSQIWYLTKIDVNTALFCKESHVELALSIAQNHLLLYIFLERNNPKKPRRNSTISISLNLCARMSKRTQCQRPNSTRNKPVSQNWPMWSSVRHSRQNLVKNQSVCEVFHVSCQIEQRWLWIVSLQSILNPTRCTVSLM